MKNPPNISLAGFFFRSKYGKIKTVLKNMSPARQVIKLKAADLNRATVRGLGRSVWEKVKVSPVKEQVHANRKKKVSKHKKGLLEEYGL
jgi:hypothetical protein